MLAKLAFVAQRLKKYLKIFCHDQQRWGGGQFLDFMGGQFLDLMGGHSCYEGGHRAHGGSPVPPPLGKILPGMAVFGRSAVVSPAFKKKFYKELQTPCLIENNNKNNRTIEKNIKLDPVFKNELKTGLYCRMSKRI